MSTLYSSFSVVFLGFWYTHAFSLYRHLLAIGNRATDYKNIFVAATSLLSRRGQTRMLLKPTLFFVYICGNIECNRLLCNISKNWYQLCYEGVTKQMSNSIYVAPKSLLSCKGQTRMLLQPTLFLHWCHVDPSPVFQWDFFFWFLKFSFLKKIQSELGKSDKWECALPPILHQNGTGGEGGVALPYKYNRNTNTNTNSNTM